MYYIQRNAVCLSVYLSHRIWMQKERVYEDNERKMIVFFY